MRRAPRMRTLAAWHPALGPLEACGETHQRPHNRRHPPIPWPALPLVAVLNAFLTEKGNVAGAAENIVALKMTVNDCGKRRWWQERKMVVEMFLVVFALVGVILAVVFAEARLY